MFHFTPSAVMLLALEMEYRERAIQDENSSPVFYYIIIHFCQSKLIEQ